MIKDIRGRFHEGVLERKGGCGDVLLVAHGHILRAFAMRWIGRELTEGVGLILEGKIRPPSKFYTHTHTPSHTIYMRILTNICHLTAGGVGTLR